MKRLHFVINFCLSVKKSFLFICCLSLKGCLCYLVFCLSVRLIVSFCVSLCLFLLFEYRVKLVIIYLILSLVYIWYSEAVFIIHCLRPYVCPKFNFFFFYYVVFLYLRWFLSYVSPPPSFLVLCLPVCLYVFLFVCLSGNLSLFSGQFVFVNGPENRNK